MITFEEKWTAWVDGQLSGRELLEFEASLPDKAAAETEKAGARKLGELLKRELSARTLTNEEFFSHQLRESIARLREAPARQARETRSTWWTIPRLLWTGALSHDKYRENQKDSKRQSACPQQARNCPPR